MQKHKLPLSNYMSPDQEFALSDFFLAADRLQELGITRSSRFLGDIGEFLYQDTVQGVELVDGLRTPGHDALRDGGKVQVKFNNSPEGTNVDVGNPSKYDEVVVVLGSRSRLREADHAPGEYRFYCFTSKQVEEWRTDAGKYYFAKHRISSAAMKYTSSGRNAWSELETPSSR